MKRVAKIVAVVLVLFVGALAAAYYSATWNKSEIRDGMSFNGVTVVKDDFVAAYIVDLTPAEVILIDAGNDPEATAILAALEKRGLEPDAVKAILLTHGDLDHILGAPRFPKAIVMMLPEDVDLAEGRATRVPFGTPQPTGVKVSRLLHDDEVVSIGDLRIRVFAVPGHTPGSAAFLVNGVLFLGDSGETTKDGKLEGGLWFACSDLAGNRESLRRLAEKLVSGSYDLKAIAGAHSGVLTNGIAPLAEFAAKR